MNLKSQDVQGQRICVITGKFLPIYAHVRVDEQSGQIGLLFGGRRADDPETEPGGNEVASTNRDLSSLASLHWYRPELLGRIYEVKPSDLEFGLGCPLAVKENDLAEFREFVCTEPSGVPASAPP